MKTRKQQFKTFSTYFLLIVSIIFSSCGDDDNPIIPVGSEGFFIVNEGGFGNGNTSLSFYDRATETVTNQVFANVNGALGDQAQSMTIFNGLGYIVVQNSAKVEIIDVNTFESVGVIDEDLPNPRHFIGFNAQKAYVSDWGADGISGTVNVIDLTTNEVTKTISTGQGADRMLLVDSELWVTNSGGYGRDNTVVIIDTVTDEIEKTITTSDNPNSIQEDNAGNIWVATKGHTAYDPQTYEVLEDESTSASIVRFSADGSELLRLDYTEVGFTQEAVSLSINAAGDRLYYLYNGLIYELAITASALPTASFSDTYYYGLSVDPIDDTVIGFEAPTFSSSGNMDFYSADGQLTSSFVVGIAPNGATFK